MTARDDAIEIAKEALLAYRCPGWIAPEDVTLCRQWARVVVDALAKADKIDLAERYDVGADIPRIFAGLGLDYPGDTHESARH